MNTTAAVDMASQLKALGLTKAGTNLEAKAEHARKLTIAYEHYRYVKQEKIDAYVAKLKAATERKMTVDEIRRSPKYVAAMQDGARFNPKMNQKELEQLVIERSDRVRDTLVLDPLHKYEGIPPQAALDKLAEAVAHKVFDSFEVAHVEPVASEVKLPDPIIFGRITGCTDRFFVAEWGEDIKLADLIGTNEG